MMLISRNLNARRYNLMNIKSNQQQSVIQNMCANYENTVVVQNKRKNAPNLIKRLTSRNVDHNFQNLINLRCKNLINKRLLSFASKMSAYFCTVEPFVYVII